MLHNRKGSQMLLVVLIVMLCIAVAMSAVTTLFFMMVQGENVEQIQHVEAAEVTVASGLNLLLDAELYAGGQTVSEFIGDSAKDLAGSEDNYNVLICMSTLTLRYGERYYFEVIVSSGGIYWCGTWPLPEDMTISSAVVYLPALDDSGNKIFVEVLLQTW